MLSKLVNAYRRFVGNAPQPKDLEVLIKQALHRGIVLKAYELDGDVHIHLDTPTYGVFKASGDTFHDALHMVLLKIDFYRRNRPR